MLSMHRSVPEFSDRLPVTQEREVYANHFARSGSVVKERLRGRTIRKIRRDDEVVVLTGKDKGKRGKVLTVRDDGRLVVSGVNMMKRHTKPNPQAGVAGGIVEKEAPIQGSNVAIFNSDSGKADRVGFKILEDKTKVRIFKSSGEVIDG